MAGPLSPSKSDSTVIIVLGASGDLAFKKTYPALFGLYKNGFVPQNTDIVGYARSHIELDDFRKRVSSKIKTSNDEEKSFLTKFLGRCTYVSGKYDDAESFKKLNEAVDNIQKNASGAKHRVFYMALPPSVFIPASEGLRQHVYAKDGNNRLIVEKPFGKDSESSDKLAQALSQHWQEEEARSPIYRIDHYLGKEMVKNLMILRFANIFFGAIWNRQYIDNVQITFKEPIGTQGRGGYFDEFGIIRDIMQNHLLQILSIVAMDKPQSLDAEHVRDEKVKVLRAIEPLTLDNVLLGQYTKSEDGKEAGYLDDEGVPKDSVTPTFAAAAFQIKNERWNGVPFILKCGKALDAQKTEVRIQFQDVPGNIYPGVARNELVVRVQPEEAVYMKFNNKQPGLSSTAITSELDLSYSRRYQDVKIPDAYESLILDVIKGDKANFVRDDELDAAWKIFTPLLHKIEGEKIKPELYPFGSRGPASLSKFVEKYGFKRDAEYNWSPPKM
ncbi:glucose-6-phosphate dehydrogenase [Fimicolochytrium jonesii]|uniref:glucose-6-phosphate dehydrogenase n=1 Tax=Fimicolochytrium jonesii TaxID=1396493 RepID=UPI0022FF17E0|nr:glucose-6-phosphate dehydrogenase [Fimicolochytrium jonesii]KAI8825792.1 glucose-6-phosphate dehydrogenase [Fimicolochytrium jonesii]